MASNLAKEHGLDNLKFLEFNLEKDDYGILGVFDIVIINMAAHHINNLKYFFKGISQIIKKDGLIVLNEYIGPNRFWSDNNSFNIINSLLNTFDDRFKLNHLLSDGSLRNEYIRTPIHHFLEHDPSEAIRSQEILKCLKKYFNVIEFKPYGGSINHMLLTGIIQNFESYEGGKDILKLLMKFEEILEDNDIITSDFALIIAEPKFSFFNY